PDGGGARPGMGPSGPARRSSPAAASWSTFTSSAASPAVPRVIEERVLPRWPYRLPRSSGGDGVVRSRDNVVERLLHVGHAPVRVRAWRTREGHVHIRAEPLAPAPA